MILVEIRCSARGCGRLLATVETRPAPRVAGVVSTWDGPPLWELRTPIDDPSGVARIYPCPRHYHVIDAEGRVWRMPGGHKPEAWYAGQPIADRLMEWPMPLPPLQEHAAEALSVGRRVVHPVSTSGVLPS